jgi:hypothetical protein
MQLALHDSHFAPTARSTLEHDPEKWEPVFGKDHTQTKSPHKLQFRDPGVHRLVGAKWLS